MNRKMRIVLAMVLSAILLLSVTGGVSETKAGTLSVTLTADEKLRDPSGVTFAMYRVGSADRTESAGNVWKTEGAYAEVDFAGAKTAKDVEAARDAIGAIVRTSGAKADYTATTGSDGQAVFASIPEGLYYVRMTRGPQGLTITPALVTMPMVTEEGVTYTFDMTPKFVVVMATPTPELPPPPPPPPGDEPTPEPTESPSPSPSPSPTLPPTRVIEGRKQWNDDGNAHGTRPASITVRLYADGVLLSSNPTWGDRSGDTWSYSFGEFPVYDEEGNEIRYVVSEIPVEYYTSSVNGMTITNDLEERPPQEYTRISGVKTWVDEDGEGRPSSITIQLYRNGRMVERREVTAEDNWSWDFGELPLDDGYGHQYVYRIHEEGVTGYVGTVEGYDVTNTKLPPPPPPPYQEHTEEELEELVDLFEYGTPLYGRLLGTGDETPIYPFVFAGVGAIAVLVLFFFGRKRRSDRV